MMRGRSRQMDIYCSVERLVLVQLERHLPSGERAFRRCGHANVLGRFECNLYSHCLLQAGVNSITRDRIMAARASQRIVPLAPQIGEANRTFADRIRALQIRDPRSPAKPSRADRDNLHQHQRPGADGTAFASPVIGVVTEIV